jgi:AmmeMemoRadiSam system protein B
MGTVRSAAVAGLFYPESPTDLERAVRDLLAHAPHADLIPKAMIVPHAGYIYSGPVAASAYTCLQPLAERIQRVVLLGPAHRVPLHGLALSDAESFATPLGDIPLDHAAIQTLAGLPQISLNPRAHTQEHALEVQLPFLQTVLRNFTLVPLVVGHASTEEVAEVIDRLWGGPETLILVSSDLSHYLPYRAARQIDRVTVDAILALEPLPHHEQACGAVPINGLLESVRRRRMQAHLLDLRNSGDTAGPHDGVVGYAAIAFTEEAAHAHAG